MAGVVGSGHPIRVGLDAPLEVARWRPFFAWVIALFTGRVPDGLAGVLAWFAWGGRVNGYAYLLTDRYPPFSTD